jgi:hypothetical protein
LLLFVLGPSRYSPARSGLEIGSGSQRSWSFGMWYASVMRVSGFVASSMPRCLWYSREESKSRKFTTATDVLLKSWRRSVAPTGTRTFGDSEMICMSFSTSGESLDPVYRQTTVHLATSSLIKSDMLARRLRAPNPYSCPAFRGLAS